MKYYRHSSLLSVVYKLFTKVVVDGRSDTLIFYLPREQAEIRKGYSTNDHIHAINQVIDQSPEYNKTLYLGFVDYEKAFYSVERAAVMRALRDHRIGIIGEKSQSGTGSCNFSAFWKIPP